MLSLVTPEISFLYVNDKCEFTNDLEEKESNVILTLINVIKYYGN